MQSSQAGVFEMEYRRNVILDMIRTEGKVEMAFQCTLRSRMDDELRHPIITVQAESERLAKAEAKIRLAFLYPGFKCTRVKARYTRYIL